MGGVVGLRRKARITVRLTRAELSAVELQERAYIGRLRCTSEDGQEKGRYNLGIEEGWCYGGQHRGSQRREVRYSIYPGVLRNSGARLALTSSRPCHRAKCEVATLDEHVRR